MLDNKLKDFKVACECEIEEYIEINLMSTIIDNKYEADIKGKIQKQLLTDIHNGLTAQSYKHGSQRETNFNGKSQERIIKTPSRQIQNNHQ